MKREDAYEHGLCTYAEIANALGVSVETVRQDEFKALAKIRRVLIGKGKRK